MNYWVYPDSDLELDVILKNKDWKYAKEIIGVG